MKLGVAASLLFVAQGVRLIRAPSRRTRTDRQQTKFIAGVPVLNYHTAYGGQAIMVELQKEVEQEWVVMVKPGSSDQQIAAMCQASKHGCNLAGHPSEGGVPFLEMRGTEADLEEVLNVVPGVAKFVEPDQEVQMIPEIHADVEAATWGLNRIGADHSSRGGAGATIFILDTGVRVSHQEFGGRAFPALDTTVGNPKECNGDRGCAADLQGHGTHCAGIAAGNAYGVAPQATVRGIKTLGDDGSGSWSFSYYALDWIAQKQERPAVASMSLGGLGQQHAMQEAVDTAVNQGVVVVVAGGNDNRDSCEYSPAFVPSAITVGSITSADARSDFSNWGACTDIWAPGSNVVSASYESDSGFRSLSGTSMACPHVSGAAALVLQENPSMKASAVLQAMQNSAYNDGISGLYSSDTNKLLFVGAGGAPPNPNPLPVGPDSDPPREGKCAGPTCRVPGRCSRAACKGCSYCSRRFRRRSR